MIQFEIKISGRVQGVGFRYFTRKKAKDLGLKGWVRNTVDGGVLLNVQGDENEINAFIDILKKGPSLALVSQIQKQKIPPTTEFSDFEIRV